MKPAPFRYVAAHSLDEALAVKAAHGEDARFLAGGQSLVPTMNFRLAQPAVLIDINPLTALGVITESFDGAVTIGALTRYRRLERDPRIAAYQPLVAQALPHVAHPQIRNRGTLGGNLAHADPASEMPAVVVALGGRLIARSPRGERAIAAADFFCGALTTALTADEMLTAIELPALPPRTGTAFLEVARRPGDYAMMGVAAVLTMDGDLCRAARLVYCSAGETPVDASAAAAALVGQRIGDAEIAEAAALARAAVEPTGSVQASAAYQRHLAGVLTARAVRQALAAAGSANESEGHVAG
jgi:aerobic carbon-monoxide dehydrogenase medium subunit